VFFFASSAFCVRLIACSDFSLQNSIADIRSLPDQNPLDRGFLATAINSNGLSIYVENPLGTIANMIAGLVVTAVGPKGMTINTVGSTSINAPSDALEVNAATHGSRCYQRQFKQTRHCTHARDGRFA
jgi:hypothetical protein